MSRSHAMDRRAVRRGLSMILAVIVVGALSGTSAAVVDAKKISRPSNFPDELPLPKGAQIRAAFDGQETEAASAKDRRAIEEALESSDADGAVLVRIRGTDEADDGQERLDRATKALRSYRKRLSKADFIPEEEAGLEVTVEGVTMQFGFEGAATSGAVLVHSNGGVRIVVTYRAAAPGTPGEEGEARFLTVEEVAERLGVSGDTVILMIQAGDLRGVPDGDSYKVRESDVEAYLETQGG